MVARKNKKIKKITTVLQKKQPAISVDGDFVTLHEAIVGTVEQYICNTFISEMYETHLSVHVCLLITRLSNNGHGNNVERELEEADVW